jgi:hypothetical protein
LEGLKEGEACVLLEFKDLPYQVWYEQDKYHQEKENHPGKVRLLIEDGIVVGSGYST